MPEDKEWIRVQNSCNRAVKILRSRGYIDEPYIDESNMPANWTELRRKYNELWSLINSTPKIAKVNTQVPFRR